MLGAHLPESVGVFWTGNQVISASYHRDDLSSISRLLARKPILWDNYPANDGKLSSEYLHLQSYTGRPYQLASWADGHIVNPMNQANLSKLVLQSLPAVYKYGKDYSPQQAMEKSLESLDDKSLALQIKSDLEMFQNQGLGTIDSRQRLQLVECYQCYFHPVASEILEWLAGDYCSDSNCLTG